MGTRSEGEGLYGGSIAEGGRGQEEDRQQRKRTDGKE